MSTLPSLLWPLQVGEATLGKRDADELGSGSLEGSMSSVFQNPACEDKNVLHDITLFYLGISTPNC